MRNSLWAGFLGCVLVSVALVKIWDVAWVVDSSSRYLFVGTENSEVVDPKTMQIEVVPGTYGEIATVCISGYIRKGDECVRDPKLPTDVYGIVDSASHGVDDEGKYHKIRVDGEGRVILSDQPILKMSKEGAVFLIGGVNAEGNVTHFQTDSKGRVICSPNDTAMYDLSTPYSGMLVPGPVIAGIKTLPDQWILVMTGDYAFLRQLSKRVLDKEAQ